jgi:hypothetical protein
MAGQAGAFGLKTAQDATRYGTDFARQTGALPGMLPGGRNAVTGYGQYGIGGMAPGLGGLFSGGSGGPPPQHHTQLARLTDMMRQQQSR